MAFDIALPASAFKSIYNPSREWADMTVDCPVVDFGSPMTHFRITLLLKVGGGTSTFGVALADDADFTQNIHMLGTTTLTVPSAHVWYLYALWGGQRYGRVVTGGAGVTYDARLEWTT